ncbi:MAG TPA: type II toxin-antitoxin system prevent-host-death family antitoxin [Candidatus Brocadiia bacterium]|nr:type II toxin-antitoxin system prevent-host-death family antitoxin [Candidatus Brocadiia bacterium]
MRVTASEARKRLGSLLDRAATGETVIITRRGKEVARIIGAGRKPHHVFPDMSKFRASLNVKGKPLSEIVIHMRDQGRY